MPKTKEITLDGKKYTVVECKIKTLEAFADDAAAVVDKIFKAETAAEGKDALKELLFDKIPNLFPGITKETIREAYPSELEELVQAFTDLHFFALKRLWGPLITVIQAGLQAR